MDLLPFELGFFWGELFSGSGSPFCSCWASIVPPVCSWKQFPELTHLFLSRAGRVFAKNSFWLLSSAALYKTHQLFPATGAGEEANCAVNPFPTKTLCRSAWVGRLVAWGEWEEYESIIPRADEQDSEVAPSYLGEKYLPSFSVKLKTILFSSSFLLVTLKLQLKEKKSS